MAEPEHTGMSVCLPVWVCVCMPEFVCAFVYVCARMCSCVCVCVPPVSPMDWGQAPNHSLCKWFTDGCRHLQSTCQVTDDFNSWSSLVLISRGQTFVGRNEGMATRDYSSSNNAIVYDNSLNSWMANQLTTHCGAWQVDMDRDLKKKKIYPGQLTVNSCQQANSWVSWLC